MAAPGSLQGPARPPAGPSPPRLQNSRRSLRKEPISTLHSPLHSRGNHISLGEPQAALHSTTWPAATRHRCGGAGAHLPAPLPLTQRALLPATAAAGEPLLLVPEFLNPLAQPFARTGEGVPSGEGRGCWPGGARLAPSSSFFEGLAVGSVPGPVILQVGRKGGGVCEGAVSCGPVHPLGEGASTPVSLSPPKARGTEGGNEKNKGLNGEETERGELVAFVEPDAGPLSPS